MFLLNFESLFVTSALTHSVIMRHVLWKCTCHPCSQPFTWTNELWKRHRACTLCLTMTRLTGCTYATDLTSSRIVRLCVTLMCDWPEFLTRLSNRRLLTRLARVRSWRSSTLNVRSTQVILWACQPHCFTDPRTHMSRQQISLRLHFWVQSSWSLLCLNRLERFFRLWTRGQNQRRKSTCREEATVSSLCMCVLCLVVVKFRVLNFSHYSEVRQTSSLLRFCCDD